MLTFNIVLEYQGLLFQDFFWFFLGFFVFQSNWPTQYQEMHSTVNKEKKGDGLRYIFFSLLASFPFFLLLALSLCFTRLCGSHISSNKWLNWFTSHQLHYYIARGGDSHLKQTGMLVVSLRGVNFGFWSRLGCSGQSANILSDVKRTSENTFHYSKIVTILATRNTDSSINHRK